MLFDDQGGGQGLEGNAYVSIAKLLLEKKLSLEQIASFLEKQFSKQEIYYALFRLQKKGIIEEADDRLSKCLSAFCHLLDLPLDSVIDRLQKTTIAVHSVGGVCCEDFKKKCDEMSIQCLKHGTVDIVFTDNYRREELQFFHKQNKPWMLVKLHGPEIWIGPLFIPGKTGCFECLSRAMKNNKIEEVLIEASRNNQSPISQNIANLPLAEPIAMNLAVNEIFKWIAQGTNENIEGSLLSFNFCSTEIRTHKVIKRPHCPSCGTPYPEEPSLPLDRAEKSTPETTFEKYRHLISPITGIVGFLKSVHDAPSVVHHNYYAGIHLADLEFIRRLPMADGIRTASGGKGKSEALAKTSCLCEAIERHSGIYQGGEIKKRARLEELGDLAIHPHSVLLFSEAQYKNREEWNKLCHRFHYIPSPFSENKEVDWTPIWSMTEEKWKWIPTALCYYSYPNQDGHQFCRADSNGCAAGNSIAEAITSGFFELVERDSVAIWWYRRLKRAEVDLASFPDPYIAELIDYYDVLKKKMWVLDLTMDLKVPTFGAFLSEASGENILFGFGSHFDPTIALIRALSEMNQSYGMSTWQNGKMFDQNRIDWKRTATIHNQTYLTPDASLPKRKMDEFFRHESSCESILREKGLEMLVLNQTRSHIGMPVVRVVVPGLRHFWNRYAPGRLYTVSDSRIGRWQGGSSDFLSGASGSAREHDASEDTKSEAADTLKMSGGHFRRGADERSELARRELTQPEPIFESRAVSDKTIKEKDLNPIPMFL